MKRLTDRFQNWLSNRAHSELRKKRRLHRSRRGPGHIVDAWFGSHHEKVRVIEAALRPPALLCFDRNTDETLAFFHKLRTSLHRSFIPPKVGADGHGLQSSWVSPGRRPGSLRWMRRYYDYSKIIEISTAAALVLAAEYDRFRRLCNSVPPTINLGDWPAPFFRTLYEVGFFEIVGLAEDVAERYRTNEGKRIMRIVSGKDAAEVTAAAEGIADLSGFLDEEEPLNASVRLALNSSLGEAMINVARHAYPEDEIMSVPHVNRWWVTASADRRKNELTVVIFDQGASIPVTFPRKELGDSIVGFLAKVLGTGPKHAFSDDGAYIAAALLPGRTQTNQVNRGLGLPEMKDLIDVCGGGELCIISRGGTCRYDIETNIQRTSSPHSIGGTLVQWRLEVGRAGA